MKKKLHPLKKIKMEMEIKIKILFKNGTGMKKKQTFIRTSFPVIKKNHFFNYADRKLHNDLYS